MFKLFALPLALASLATAQTTSNLFEIYPGCTNYTSRGSLGTDAGELLLQVPATSFAGVAHNDDGRSAQMNGFQCVGQDQDGRTPETYYNIVRCDIGGQPDCSRSGQCLRVGPFTVPGSSFSGPIAWVLTTNLATPFTTCPTPCVTFYMGIEVAAAPAWTTDGLSIHIATSVLTGGTQADNPAPGAPNLAWECRAGTPNQSDPVRTLRIGVLTPAAVLNIGNVDNTMGNSNCLSAFGNRSFGVGGMFPRCQGSSGPRNDGLDFRVRDVSNAGGFAFVFAGTPGSCPGQRLGGVAYGALYLNSGGALLQVGSAGLDYTGTGIGTILPPQSPVCTSLVNRRVYLQSFSVGPSLSLPGRLSNECIVRYMQ